MSDELLCVGEILWDALPDGLFLGGAPFNVASHLHALHQEVAFVSRVGDDRLGREALRRMRARGLETELMQIDDSLPTGFVQVELGDTGEPDYEILEPAAWDAITLSAPPCNNTSSTPKLSCTEVSPSGPSPPARRSGACARQMSCACSTSTSAPRLWTPQ